MARQQRPVRGSTRETPLMRIAADLVNAKVAAATAFVPPSVPIRVKAKKVVPEKKEEAAAAGERP